MGKGGVKVGVREGKGCATQRNEYERAAIERG